MYVERERWQEEERKEGGREEHNYIERPKGEREGGDRGKE